MATNTAAKAAKRAVKWFILHPLVGDVSRATFPVEGSMNKRGRKFKCLERLKCDRSVNSGYPGG